MNVRIAPLLTAPIGGRSAAENFRAVQRQPSFSGAYQPEISWELTRLSAIRISDARGGVASSSVRLLMSGGLYGFALWATARDPEMLRILLASSKARRRYDPGKHERVDMEVVPW